MRKVDSRLNDEPLNPRINGRLSFTELILSSFKVVEGRKERT